MLAKPYMCIKLNMVREVCRVVQVGYKAAQRKKDYLDGINWIDRIRAKDKRIF